MGYKTVLNLDFNFEYIFELDKQCGPWDSLRYSAIPSWANHVEHNKGIYIDIILPQPELYC